VRVFSGDDGSLIASSRERPELFDEVFRRYFAEIYRFAERQLGATEGEEVASETFARAFAQRARFSARGSARAWLYGICINVARDQRRGAARCVRKLAAAYERDVVGGGVEASDAALDARERRGELLCALGKLRSVERDVLVLFALADLSYAEIAETLGLPLGTVRSHLFRARRSLREDLGPQIDDDTPPAFALTSEGGCHE
jgi:RNA polymerase sigma factor (sigma-70 family)